MSTRELRALGVGVENSNTNPNSTNNEDSNINVSTNVMETATTAAQVNPLYDTIDLSLAEGKKLHQKATQGLPDDQKYKGNPKDVINFMERIKNKSEDFRWDSITNNIGPNNVNLFETPGVLTVQECKDYCDPRWVDGSNQDNVQICIKSNMFYLFVKKQLCPNCHR